MHTSNIHNVSKILEQWSDAEKAEALRRILEFPLGTESFIAYCGTVPTVPMEFCILNQNKSRILLFRRPDNDPVFPGQWHVSGGLQLPGMRRINVWTRLWQGEKYGLKDAMLSIPIEIGTQDTQKGPQENGDCPRGQECNIIHVVLYEAGPVGDGEWFHLNKLPGSIIGHHRKYLIEKLIPWLRNRE